MARSRDAFDFIWNMLQVSPVGRFSAQEALNHPWIKKNREVSLKKVGMVERLDNLRNYHSDQITHCVMNLIAHHRMVDSNEQKLIFMMLDDNHDGTLNEDDLVKNGGCTEEDAEKIMKEANGSKSGALSYTEWLVASSDKSELMSAENLKKVFDWLDTRKKGIIQRH